MKASSTLKSLDNIDISVLGTQDLQEMSPQDKIWAQQQFRLIYAQEMSKLTSEIMHQNRIKNNLQRVNLQEKEEIHKNYLRLKQKMDSTDDRRQKKIDQTKKVHKNQQVRWEKKMEDIQKRFRSQNRQAIQKAEKYRRESEDYFYKKEKSISSSKQIEFYQKSDLSKTYKYIKGQSINSNTIRFKNDGQNKTKKYLKTLRPKQQNDHSFSKYPLSQNRTIDINEEIVRHKKRSQSIQQEKQNQIFSAAMKKFLKIQQSRKKAQKLKISSRSPTEIKKLNSENQEEEDDGHKNFYSNKNNQRSSISTIKKQSLNESMQSHLQAKKLIQEQKFLQRNKLVEDQLRRKKQDKILKIIKNKVKDIKKSALKLALQNQS